MLFVLAMVAPLLVVAAGLAAGRAAGPTAPRWSRWLRFTALAAAAIAATLLAPAVFRDSGAFAFVLLGVPVALAAVPVGLTLATGGSPAVVDWLAAVLAMVWAILLALGIGLAFVPAALLQFAAAAVATGAGRSARVGPAG